MSRLDDAPELALMGAKLSDGGFLYFPRVTGYLGASWVETYESSLATEPALWLHTRGLALAGDMAQATAHLPLPAAETLATHLRALIDHHYQVRYPVCGRTLNGFDGCALPALHEGDHETTVRWADQP